LRAGSDGSRERSGEHGSPSESHHAFLP
jgi:hypothetical protein